jgi:type IV secretory pathway VirD2 relaxase
LGERGVSDFDPVRGFEDLWRPVARPRRIPDQGVLPTLPPPSTVVKARLARIAARAPEVMVKITGRTKGAGHLRAHLEYIARDGALPLEGRDGDRLEGQEAIRERGADWAADDLKARGDSSLSISIVLSMPAGTPAGRMRDAARAFAAEMFAERHDYVFALHTDAGHPHVHLAVRTLGSRGVRLNPRKADLDAWRQSFARHLRARDIAAEATPRRARGVVRKAERMPLRKLRDRHERDPDRHPPSDRQAEAEREAARIVSGARVERPWEAKILRQQRRVRAAYQAAADRLAGSNNAGDRTLAAQLLGFLKAMPVIATRLNELVRAERALGGPERADPDRTGPDRAGRGPDRKR